MTIAILNEQKPSPNCHAGVPLSPIFTRGIETNWNLPAALHFIQVRPIPFIVAKKLITEHHYLHSLPGGTMLTFGIFVGSDIFGAMAFGAGPQNAFNLVNRASRQDCLTLTRLWLDDQLPPNAESRVIGIVLKALKRYTYVKFVVTYADPSQEHVGTIYQATNWLYTGLSKMTPLYDIGDGKPKHSRSLGQIYGTHSVKYLSGQGLPVKLVPQSAKHRYLYFLNSSWQDRLKVRVLPYPKKEIANENS
jgi:hypothetical protein